MGFYDYSVKNAKGEDVPMSDYEGKVVLVVYGKLKLSQMVN